MATVGETSITVADFEQELSRRASRPGRFTTAESRRDLLDEMVEHRLRVEAARAAGYEEDPEIVRALEVLLAAKLERERLQPVLAALEVPDDEVLAHYQATPELYRTPEQVRVAIVRLDLPVSASSERLAEVEAAAATLLDEVRSIAPSHGFGDLARRFSADRASRYVGGVVGWLVRGDRYRWPAEVVEAAFGLDAVGDVGEVELADRSTGGGARYLVRLIERRPAALRPLATVRDGIRRELLRRKSEAARAELHDELRRRHRVEIDTAAFDLAAPTEAEGPPATPGR